MSTITSPRAQSNPTQPTDLLDTAASDIEPLRIDDLTRDPDLQPRAAELDEATVERYLETIENGGKLPPVTVFFDGEKYWLADGWHREAAFRLAGLDKINAMVYPGDRRAARDYVASHLPNADHGLPETAADRKRRVMMVIEAHPDWSIRQIAEWTRVPRATVQDWKHAASCPDRTAPADARDGANTEPEGDDDAGDIEPEPEIGSFDEADDPEEASEAGDDEPDEGGEPTGGDDGQPRDAAGQPIPEQLQHVFSEAAELREIRKAAIKLKSRLKRAKQLDAGARLLIEQRAMIELGNIAEALKHAQPTNICPSCAGDGCAADRGCRGAGWVTADAFKQHQRAHGHE